MYIITLMQNEHDLGNGDEVPTVQTVSVCISTLREENEEEEQPVTSLVSFCKDD